MTKIRAEVQKGAVLPWLVLVLAMPFSQACTDEWHLVVSEPWRFSILMPGAPATTTVEAEGERWRGQAFRLDPARVWLIPHKPERFLSYSARAEAVPAGWTFDSVVARLFDERTDAVGLPRGSGTRTPIEYNGIKGVELRVVLSGVEHVVRVFMADEIAYTIEVLGAESEMSSQVLSKYFDSFRVTGGSGIP